MAFAHAIGSFPYWCVVMFLCERAQTPNAITKRYHQTQASNAITKRKHQTQPLMGATRPASGFLRQRFTDRRVISAACEPLLGV